MNKEKGSAGVSQANVPGVPRVVVSSERAKPAEPGKKRLRRICDSLGCCGHLCDGLRGDERE